MKGKAAHRASRPKVAFGNKGGKEAFATAAIPALSQAFGAPMAPGAAQGMPAAPALPPLAPEAPGG